MNRGDYQYVVGFLVSNRVPDAEDIAQQAFLVEMTQRNCRVEVRELKRWVATIAAGIAKDRARTRAVRLSAHERFDSTAFDTEAPPPEIQEAGLEAELKFAVAGLPRKYRLPIELFYYEEMSLEQVAERLNTTVATIKARMFRGRALLKERYAS